MTTSKTTANNKQEMACQQQAVPIAIGFIMVVILGVVIVIVVVIVGIVIVLVIVIVVVVCDFGCSSCYVLFIGCFSVSYYSCCLFL